MLGDNEAKWWTVGLSVMATQASAITFMSTPGQAFHDGMGFVQFYFGLPIAMAVSYTHLDVYKRQIFSLQIILFAPSFFLHLPHFRL